MRNVRAAGQCARVLGPAERRRGRDAGRRRAAPHPGPLPV